MLERVVDPRVRFAEKQPAEGDSNGQMTDVAGQVREVFDSVLPDKVEQSFVKSLSDVESLELAQAAGVNIIGVVTITESGGQAPQPVYMARAEVAFDGAAASTPVLPGEDELSISVHVQYEIE